jgi:hypothetical protein
VGAGWEAPLVARAVNAAQASAPDLVVWTGDLVAAEIQMDTPPDLSDIARRLAQARGRYGAYAVLGNHDVEQGADVVARYMEAAGINVLRNERVALEINGATLWILGIEDAGVVFCRDWKAFKALYQPQTETLAELLADVPPGFLRDVAAGAGGSDAGGAHTRGLRAPAIDRHDHLTLVFWKPLSRRVGPGHAHSGLYQPGVGWGRRAL